MNSKFLKSIVPIFLSCFVSLILVEVTLRVLDLYSPPSLPLRAERPDLYQFDENVGYRLWRSTAALDQYPGNSPELLPIVSNSDGFRGARDFGDPDSRKRILVVGDSFVFGIGVRAEQRLTEVLEAMEPSWRVDNLGMSGWGIDLMLRGIEHIGPKARPDVIVVAVYTDDFRRVVPNYPGIGFPIPKYELKDGTLVTKPYPSTTGWRRLRVFQLLRHLYWNYIGDSNRLDLNEALLDLMIEMSARQGSQLVVMFLPGKVDTYGDSIRRGFLRDWTGRRQIPYADLTGPLRAAGVKNAYIAGNLHWSSVGHQIAAEALRDLLNTTIGLTERSKLDDR